MNFRQLEVLVSVIRCGSFSKAAEELFLTQPTISAHIRSLEDELEVVLIKRGHKTAIPTPAGAAFYEYANGLLRMRDGVADSMKNYTKLLSSSLEIAASTVPGEYILPKLIADFAKEYPNLRVTLKESGSREVLAKLLNGEAELGFTGAELRNERCVFEDLTADRLVIITPVEDPFTHIVGDELPAEVLKDAPFILRLGGSATQKEADAYLINLGISPQSIKAVAYMDSTEAIRRSVSCGLGIAIISQFAAENMAKQNEILMFAPDNPFLHRRLYCAYRNDTHLSPAAELFLNFAKQRTAK